LRDESVKRWSRVHNILYRLTGGLFGRRMVDNDILLLSTTGRRSGEAHTVPLLYLRDGDRLVVIASYGGRPDHPAWYHNLVADPKVGVQIRSDRTEMLARTADPAERDLWWPRIVGAYAGYADYQSRTDRVIPVVFLVPIETG